MMMEPVTPMLSDPPTDKKPPVGPTSVRSSSSLERTAPRPAIQSQSEQQKTSQPERMVVTAVPDALISKKDEILSENSGPQNAKKELVEDLAPSAAGMRSRLQRLAEQRKCWDGGKNMLLSF